MTELNRIYKLAAIDVDGTLLNSHGNISTDIPPLLQEVPARGIGVTLASGRPKVTLMPLLAELGLALPYISSGGAYIIDPAKGTIIDHQTLERDVVTVMVELARAAKMAIMAITTSNSMRVKPRLRCMDVSFSVRVENARYAFPRSSIPR